MAEFSPHLTLGIGAALLVSTFVAAEPETTGEDISVAKHMRLHFTSARAIRAYVIAGQMEGIPEAAEWLIDHEATPGLPGDWHRMLTR